MLCNFLHQITNGLNDFTSASVLAVSVKFLILFYIMRAVLSPPRPPALRGGFNAVSLTRSDRAGNGAVCRK